MPGSGIFSYTNYKMTTKSNPYLGSILPESNIDTVNTWKHMPIGLKGRTQSHVNKINSNLMSNVGSGGGRRKREIKDVIRKANEMDASADNPPDEGNLEIQINNV